MSAPMNLDERDRNRLLDMREAAQRAVTFTQGKARADLEADEQLLGFAVVRAIEVVGEAASKITPAARQQLPQIPWHNIIGMRNRVIHDYLNVDYDIVWAVVTQNLPPLIAQLDAVLAA